MPLNLEDETKQEDAPPSRTTGASGSWDAGPRAPIWQARYYAMTEEERATAVGQFIRLMLVSGYTDDEITRDVNEKMGIGAEGAKAAGQTARPWWWNDVDDVQRQNWLANQTRLTGGGSTALSDFDVQWGAMTPEQRQQYIQLQLGGATPWQQQQWEAQQAQAAQSYDLQNRQFAWQQEQAARAEEERRKERVVEWNKRPATWLDLWMMYGGDQGRPAGYTAPALEAGMNTPSWVAALSGQPQVAYTGSVPTSAPLPSLLRGAMEGLSSPKQAFAMPAGAGGLPSAQYLNKMPKSAVEGLGAAYESEWGLSWEDMVQMIQRSLPQKSAGQVVSLGALRR